MPTYALDDDGRNLLTREQGAKVRHELQAIVRGLAPGEVLTVEFSGVDAITPSFVDEALGRLLLELGEDRFRSAVRLGEAREAMRRLVNRVLAHRAKEARQRVP